MVNDAIDWVLVKLFELFVFIIQEPVFALGFLILAIVYAVTVQK